MRRLYVAMMVVAATAMVPSPAAATLSVTCDYSGAQHKVTMTLVGDVSPVFVHRDSLGHILLNDIWCDGIATVTNTDTIVLTGDSHLQAVALSLDYGFQPGWTNEAGTSDEIEFSINLGGNNLDALAIYGTSGVDRIDLGQNNRQFGLVRHINLNSGEQTGIDSDIAVTGLKYISINGEGGNDVIRAQGGFGTGPDPYGPALTISGGGGADQIKGGSGPDQLIGNKGDDTIWGMKGNDSIDLSDGSGGDVGHGGAGADTCSHDGGDVCDQL